MGLSLTEALPLRLLAFSAICHLIYLQNFSATWPLISLTSPGFIASCLAVVADHFLWFTHFAHQAQAARQRARSHYQSAPGNGAAYSFWETTSFFVTCVWLIPLFLFLSLSANDHALPISLPSDSDGSSSRNARGARTSLIKKTFNFLPETLIPTYMKSRNSQLPLSSPTHSLPPSDPDLYVQRSEPQRSQRSNNISRPPVSRESSPRRRLTKIPLD